MLAIVTAGDKQESPRSLREEDAKNNAVGKGKLEGMQREMQRQGKTESRVVQNEDMKIKELRRRGGEYSSKEICGKG